MFEGKTYNRSYVDTFWQNIWLIQPGISREQTLVLNTLKHKIIHFGLLFYVILPRNMYLWCQANGWILQLSDITFYHYECGIVGIFSQGKTYLEGQKCTWVNKVSNPVESSQMSSRFSLLWLLGKPLRVLT